MNARTPPHKVAEILRQLKAGLICAEIARNTSVTHCTVLRIARRHGIKPKRLPPAVALKRFLAAVEAQGPMPQETNYRAQAANLRWGNQLGGRWM